MITSSPAEIRSRVLVSLCMRRCCTPPLFRFSREEDDDETKKIEQKLGGVDVTVLTILRTKKCGVEDHGTPADTLCRAEVRSWVFYTWSWLER